MAESKEQKIEKATPEGTSNPGLDINRAFDDPASVRTIWQQHDQVNADNASKFLAQVELRGTSMHEDYVDGSELSNPDSRARQQIDSLTRTLPVWEQRLNQVLDDLAHNKPHAEEKLTELLHSYAGGSKNLSKYMTADQKRQLMEMAEKATDVLLQRKLAAGDYRGAYDVLGTKLSVDANLTLNAPKPHHHLIKDLQKMVDLCHKYKINGGWYWEDKLKEETVE